MTQCFYSLLTRRSGALLFKSLLFRSATIRSPQNLVSKFDRLRVSSPLAIPARKPGALKRQKAGEEKVESRYKRFARSYRSMHPRNFAAISDAKFLKSRYKRFARSYRSMNPRNFFDM